MMHGNSNNNISDSRVLHTLTGD